MVSKESVNNRGEPELTSGGADPVMFKYYVLAKLCHYSSVVEHVIGNDGVASPILANGTIS